MTTKQEEQVVMRVQVLKKIPSSPIAMGFIAELCLVGLQIEMQVQEQTIPIQATQ